MIVSALFALVLGSAAVFGGEAPPPPPPEPEGDSPAAEAVQKYLEEATKSWFSAQADGMKSVIAEVKVDATGKGWGSEDAGGSPGRWDRKPGMSGIEADWSWSDVGSQQLHIHKAARGKAGAWQKTLDKLTGEAWRGVAGVPFGPFPEKYNPELAEEGAEKIVRYMRKKKPFITVRFSASTGLPLSVEQVEGKRTKVTRFGFGKEGEKNVLKSIQVSNEAGTEIKGQTTYSWDGFREVNGRPLPTVVRIDFGNRMITFRFTFTQVNGTPAKVKEVGKEEVVDLAKLLSKAFKSGSIVEKQHAIQGAKDADTDQAAQLLARYVYDKDVGVEVAKALGKMGKKSAVSTLVSAFSKTRKQRELHEAVIWALGEIGDPRAVKPLAANIWGGAGSEGWGEVARHRIRALGKIRHTSSVDQLIDMSDDGRRRWGNAVRGEVYRSLKNLTGQGFRSSREWKGWWKKNRSTFRF